IVASALARAEADHALRRAVEFDQRVAGLATSLIRVPADGIDAQIVETLGTVGELLGADRASVIVRHASAVRTLTCSHQWVRTGASGPPLSFPEDAFPWLVARVMGARDLVILGRLDELPHDAGRDRASLEQFGVASGALAPMVVEDHVVGMVSVAASRE